MLILLIDSLFVSFFIEVLCFEIPAERLRMDLGNLGMRIMELHETFDRKDNSFC